MTDWNYWALIVLVLFAVVISINELAGLGIISIIGILAIRFHIRRNK